VLFRADGSETVGMGHIMRCLAFAAGLAGLGIDSVFLTKPSGAGAGQLISSQGHRTESLAEQADWPAELSETKRIATDIGAGVVVTDICHRLNQAQPKELVEYHRSLASEYFTVAFGGDVPLKLPANLVIIPYVGLGEIDHIPTLGQTLLYGGKYFLPMPKFLATAGNPREIKARATNILVTIGGSDELHLTSFVLGALSLVETQELTIKVVFGAGFTGMLKSECVNALQRIPGDHESLTEPDDMPGLMLWADLAIIGDGLTKYEAAFTGTPSIMVCRPDRKVRTNEEFAKQGTTLYLGYERALEEPEMVKQIDIVLNDLSMRQKMSDEGRKLVDGQGFDRIISHIPDLAR
jgi:spore coat polysaccharide biosynthesis predicted glycosyltransferase SpsG